MIATVMPSEDIDEPWWLLAQACWVMAAILGLIALILCLLPRKHQIKALWVSLTGGLLSVYPILFALHVYRVDYIPVEMDGTPASPPLISAMTFPLMPLGGCMLTACIAFGRHRRIEGDHGNSP